MRYLLCLFLFLSACANSNDSSPSSAGACSGRSVVGTWTNTVSGEILVLNANCTGSSLACNSSFEYAFAASDPTFALVRILSTGAGSCLPVGDHSCHFNTTSTTMLVDCGYGVMSYAR